MRVLQLGSINPLALTSNLQLPTAQQPSFGTRALNFFNQLLPTVVQTKQTVDYLRNRTGTAPGVMNTTYQAQQPEPTKIGLSTGAKVAIGVAGAAVVTGIVYAVTRKKKSKK